MKKLDPLTDFEQVISNFEQLQSDYQQALAAKEAQEQNERVLREVYFAQQRNLHEQAQKRDRRAEFCRKLIDRLSLLISEFESQGQTLTLNQRLRSVQTELKFQGLDAERLKNGEC